MKRINSIIAAILTITTLALSAPAQTRIVAPKNPYSLDKDVQLGQQAANEADRKLPVIKDRQLQSYLEHVGRRLVEAIPPEFQHSEFHFTFSLVDSKEINAFALPGGFTYVNRGLIEVAHNEGELAGVMAHEISHVALRHGTAQAAKAQKYQVGAAAGQILGAILGGGLGSVVAAGSKIGISAAFLRYSREYESQADLLGARIMANAGYDPHDLANMFRTIEKEAGSRNGPEWLSDHPNPGNRYEAINHEAQYLHVRNPIENTAEFSRAQARLHELPHTRNEGGNERSTNDPRANDSRTSDSRTNDPAASDSRPRTSLGGTVSPPSARLQSRSFGNFFQLNVPENWRALEDRDSVTYAPEGAYGEVQGRFIFTHGMLAGVTRAQSRDLREATEQFIHDLQQGNPKLRRQRGLQGVNIAGRAGLSASFSNTSDITGQAEFVSVYTVMLGNGDLFYLIPVAPQHEYRSYQRTFQNIVRSISLNE